MQDIDSVYDQIPIYFSLVKKIKWLEEQIIPVILYFCAIAMANVVSKDSKWYFGFTFEERKCSYMQNKKKNPYYFSNCNLDSF